MINGERVRQARELHRMTQGRLIEDVPDLTQSRLSRIEKGKAELAAEDLAAATIAAATGVTVDWLSRPPTSGLTGLSPHFRARSRTTEATKASGLAWASLVNEAHVVLSNRVRTIPVLLERGRGSDPRQAAREMRQQLGFSALEPLPYLVLAVERLGVRILGLPWSAETVDAFCAWAEDVPTIALSANVPGDRRRWTVAHELGHLVLHGVDEKGKDIEQQADAFAAELLTPLDALKLQMPAHPTLRTLTMLKSQWGVSVKSLVRRARELGAVDDERATSLYRQISARGWNKAEPGYVPLEKPRALRKMVEVALPRVDGESLAKETGWSVEMADLVLDQHARMEELPPIGDTGGDRTAVNVIPLHRRAL
jgi:Zn-dependent peptidase ImmA (M78 family)/transcriptional regulator with XRE-family HTH domain